MCQPNGASLGVSPAGRGSEAASPWWRPPEARTFSLCTALGRPAVDAVAGLAASLDITLCWSDLNAVGAHRSWCQQWANRRITAPQAGPLTVLGRPTHR